MSRKNSRKTSAPKVARRKHATVAPIDPRLRRVFDVIDEHWSDDRNQRDWEPFVAQFLDVLPPDADGLKAMLAALIKNSCENEVGVSNALDKMREIADAEHRAYCACCRGRHEAEQEATVQ